MAIYQKSHFSKQLAAIFEVILITHKMEYDKKDGAKKADQTIFMSDVNIASI